MSAKIVVVGSSNTDMVVKADHIPAPGETVLGGEFIMVPGGKGANQAVAAVRLGADVTFICRIGTDPFGDKSIANFKQEGIDVSYIHRDMQAPSGVAIITVDRKGENAITVAPGANAKLSPADVEMALPAFENADVLLLQFETPIETVLTAAKIAKQKGMVVIVNPAPSIPVPDELLKLTTIITPNRVEAFSLVDGFGDEEPRELAAKFLDKGVESVVITLGSHGAFIASGGVRTTIPAISVTPVDTTAAGDAFNGALAVGIAEGKSLQAAVEFASKSAAISVTRMGAQSSLPYRKEVEDFVF